MIETNLFTTTQEQPSVTTHVRVISAKCITVILMLAFQDNDGETTSVKFIKLSIQPIYQPINKAFYSAISSADRAQRHTSLA